MDRHSFVEATDGTPLAVSQTGPTDAPLNIVFSHGLALSHHVWTPQCRHFARLFGAQTHLVFYDQRGHGNSHEPRGLPTGYTIAQIGADLATVISGTCPHGPVVAVGHSLGGMAILAMAHHQPAIAGRLAGVGLISTAACQLATAGLGRALNTPAVPLLEHIVDYAPRITHRAWNIVRAAAGPALGVPVTRTADRSDTVSIRALIGILSALRDHDETAGLATLKDLSCLVACGEADPVTPLQHSLTLCKHLPKARLLTAARAGHMLPLERPRLINDALAAMAAALLRGRAA